MISECRYKVNDIFPSCQIEIQKSVGAILINSIPNKIGACLIEPFLFGIFALYVIVQLSVILLEVFKARFTKHFLLFLA